MVTFYFVKSGTWIGKIIRFISGGKYNHVSIWVRGYLYEAKMNKGVTKVRCDRDHRSNEWIHHFDLNEEEVVKFLDKQVGKKYDWLGVISFLWIFIKQGKKKWFCSEIAMVALMKGLGKKEYNQRQSPIDFYYLLKILQ